MTGKIYLLGQDEQLLAMSEKAYESESLLQELLGKYPDLLAGEQIHPTEPRRWVLVKREMGVADRDDAGDRWSLDHLFLDQDGIPTLIEVKRSTDSRIRREVVGQMLDYAANAVTYWPVEKIRAEFEATCEREKQNAEDILRNLIDPDSDSDDLDTPTLVEEYWETVSTNLAAEKIRLVFVADEIPRELRQIIEFLNGQMDPAEVVGIEVKQYAGQDIKTLVPTLVGQTAKSAGKKRRAVTSNVTWTEQTWLEEMARLRGKDAASAASRLLSWAKDNYDIYWTTKQKGGFTVYKPLDSRGVMSKWFIAFRCNLNSGVLFPFIHARKRPPFSDRTRLGEWLAKLNEIPGQSFSDSYLDSGAPTIQMDVAADENVLTGIMAAAKWASDQVQAD